ncbi:MAG TPA: sugar phosphate isomerase/epimerase [Firmicutes bacterium]|nr:sugar phosphate isomerase/epimerase [Bacillota bacterium]
MFKLGLVTYNMAKDWSIEEIIAKCRATGFRAVELRTTHAHGVEPTIDAARRREVKAIFADSDITLWGLGTICEYHAVDPAEVQRNIDETIEFVKLAADLGCRGVKVRPNGFQDKAGIPREKTLEQIGLALKKCGEAAADYGVEIWLEVHGATRSPAHIRQILDITAHPSVGACWNSNADEPEEGSIARGFALLRDYIKSVHINELTNDYPWRELFRLLRESGYDRYTLAEIPGSSDPERVMRYYARLWQELVS